MIRLRPFKISDAKYLIEWVKDERSFSMWCADKFEYPLTEHQLTDYKEMYEKDEYGWSFTAINEVGIPVGHLLMRNADYDNQSIHLGFVIVDEKYRGKGIGKEMISLAIKYAYEILKVKTVTLAVFDNNPSALNCYKASGFVEVSLHKEIFPYNDEKWGVYNMKIEEKSI